MADDLVAEVESRKLVGRCVVLGHSLGAVVCLIAEIQNPGLFRGLWCFEPVLFASLAGLKYSEFFSKSHSLKMDLPDEITIFDQLLQVTHF